MSPSEGIPEEDMSPVVYIASCDIGTTTARCYIYNNHAEICGKAESKLNLLYPQPGHVEINPNEFWEIFVNLVKSAISASGLEPTDIKCLGLSTLRGTFTTWDCTTGECLHNFITWNDIRSSDAVKEWNKSLTMKVLRCSSFILYHLLWKKKYLASSVFKFNPIQTNLKLKWVLDNNSKSQELIKKKRLMFGTVDSWLIFKLTGGKVHATDYSNASGTGIFDPFLMKWSDILMKLLGFPSFIFPEVKDSSGFYGICSPELFGAEIPITAVVSDQGAALFGGCGFRQGSVKVTLGTGAFLDINTGSKPHASVSGIYPVVGWKDRNGVVFMAEGSSSDNGSVLEWAQKNGFFYHPSNIQEILSSHIDSGGVYFVPGFQGLQAPVDDPSASAGFIGITLATEKVHLIKAMVDSLAFRVVQIYNTMMNEADYELLDIRVDGGVAQNDYILQLIANLTRKKIIRLKTVELSSLGCCFLAGLGGGIWKSYKELELLVKMERSFFPEEEYVDAHQHEMKRWAKAVKRFLYWH